MKHRIIISGSLAALALFAVSVEARPASPPAPAGGIPGVIETQLAGNSLTQYPYVEYVRAFNEGFTIELAIDPTVFPAIVGQTADLYIVDAKTVAEWTGNPALVDVSVGVETVVFSGTDIQSNTFLIDGGTLTGMGAAPWLDIGIGYDLVIDMNQNGQLDSGDYIDGLEDEAGAYVVHDITAGGPLAVTEIIYSGGFFLGQDTYRPTSIAAFPGTLPLVVVSHGNGHNYQWYDHIGEHLASYGYIVMSHQNNTGPGIEIASGTTLSNTDYFLNNLATIDSGSMLGKVDDTRITWIGHSRGGEGVVRAYDRIFDGTFVPTSGYDENDIRLVSSIAPTDFLQIPNTDPHSVNYHLWTGEADSDVNGCASCDLCQTFQLHDRALQYRQSLSLHGVGHGNFHDGGGNPFASGPCLIGTAFTHNIMRGYLFPLVEHYVDGSIPAKDFLWRQYESFRPIGGVTGICVVVDKMYREGDAEKFVIDDFQSNSSTGLSSSGQRVIFSVANLSEGDMDDSNTTFTNLVSDTFNGFTSNGNGADFTKGVVFEWNGGDNFIAWVIPMAARDFGQWEYLSFRACQGTRHALTTADLGDTTFDVTIQDRLGVRSTINIGAYGGGIEEPYQRTSCGSGTGWANEFETIRIRVADFRN
ncbi:MAG: hypothetical protein O7B99_08130, partial [Planctomycetota bacterium]|nr:hypothetical protein [Planctomycetota bacterium]